MHEVKYESHWSRRLIIAPRVKQKVTLKEAVRRSQTNLLISLTLTNYRFSTSYLIQVPRINPVMVNQVRLYPPVIQASP